MAEGLYCLTSKSFSRSNSLIIFSLSSESYIEKLLPNPTLSAFFLSIIAPIEWNVPIVGIPFLSCFSSFNIPSTLSCISPAAFFVNVTARILSGLTPFSLMRYAILFVITRVFPEPAPAKTRRGPSVVITAFFCSGFKP